MSTCRELPGVRSCRRRFRMFSAMERTHRSPMPAWMSARMRAKTACLRTALASAIAGSISMRQSLLMASSWTTTRFLGMKLITLLSSLACGEEERVVGSRTSFGASPLEDTAKVSGVSLGVVSFAALRSVWSFRRARTASFTSFMALSCPASLFNRTSNIVWFCRMPS